MLAVCSLASAKLHFMPGLSHCERESLILNEDLVWCLSSASGASLTDRRPDSLSTGGIKLAPIFGSLSAKQCYRVYVKDRGEVVWDSQNRQHRADEYEERKLCIAAY